MSPRLLEGPATWVQAPHVVFWSALVVQPSYSEGSVAGLGCHFEVHESLNIAKMQPLHQQRRCCWAAAFPVAVRTAASS